MVCMAAQGLIVLNVGVLAADKYPSDGGSANTFEMINFVLTMVFALETSVKVLSMGFRRTMREAFNIFDAFIVFVSLVEIIVSPPAFLTPEEDFADGGGGATALRTFRLFRLFRFAKKWVSLRKLLQTIVRTMKDIANFTVLLVIVIYIMAMFGLSIFANRMHFDPATGEAIVNITSPAYTAADIPRSNFDGLILSVTTVFQVCEPALCSTLDKSACVTDNFNGELEQCDVRCGAVSGHCWSDLRTCRYYHRVAHYS